MVVVVVVIVTVVAVVVVVVGGGGGVVVVVVVVVVIVIVVMVVAAAAAAVVVVVVVVVLLAVLVVVVVVVGVVVVAVVGRCSNVQSSIIRRDLGSESGIKQTRTVRFVRSYSELSVVYSRRVFALSHQSSENSECHTVSVLRTVVSFFVSLVRRCQVGLPRTSRTQCPPPKRCSLHLQVTRRTTRDCRH